MHDGGFRLKGLKMREVERMFKLFSKQSRKTNRNHYLQEFQKSEAFTLANCQSMGLTLLDKDFNMVWINPKLSNLLKMREEACVNQDISLIIPSLESKEIKNEIRQRFKSNYEWRSLVEVKGNFTEQKINYISIIHINGLVHPEVEMVVLFFGLHQKPKEEGCVFFV